MDEALLCEEGIIESSSLPSLPSSPLPLPDSDRVQPLSPFSFISSTSIFGKASSISPRFFSTFSSNFPSLVSLHANHISFALKNRKICQKPKSRHLGLGKKASRNDLAFMKIDFIIHIFDFYRISQNIISIMIRPYKFRGYKIYRYIASCKKYCIP